MLPRRRVIRPDWGSDCAQVVYRAGVAKEERAMSRSIWIAVLMALLIPLGADANPELISMSSDDGQWVIPGKNYSSTRYSSLNQITTDTVKKLRPAWTFSTGALRGHEGQP